MKFQRREILSALAAAPLVRVRPSAADQRRPRLIIFMMFDDLGKPLAYDPALMPNWHDLRAEGLEFTHVYSMALCVPSRATLLSGLYPFTSGWAGHWAHWEHVHSPTLYLSLEQRSRETGTKTQTFAQLLEQAGWRTVVAGKWHLGDAARGRETFMRRLGWQRWHVWDGDLVTGQRGTNRYRGEPLFVGSAERGQTMVRRPDAYAEDLFLETVLEEIGRAAAHPDQRTLIYYPLLLPHKPIVPPPGAGSKTDDDAIFGAMVSYGDRALGAVVDEIRRLGLAGETVMIVTSDNGTAEEGKGELSERGVCVPFTAWGPGLVGEGERTAALADFSDISATLCELGGASAPEDVDGFSFAAKILSLPGRVERDWICSSGLGRMEAREDGTIVAAEYPFIDRVLRTREVRLEPDGELAALDEPASGLPLEKIGRRLRKAKEDMGTDYALKQADVG